ncbi:MAG: methyl-accepting chemotaxis protein [Magnetospirillum sp.]|nr:methyl-accepting chemotaxis protein [Magnetospirillum sp.]
MATIDESLSVGVPDLDSDHQNLLRLIDRLSGAQSHKQVTLLAAEVADHMHLHFRREEDMLEAYGWPGLAAHRDEHRQFEGRLADFLTTLTPDNAARFAQDLRETLATWFTGHVAGSDMRYRDHMRRAMGTGKGRLGLKTVRIAVLLPALLVALATPLLIATGLIVADNWRDRSMAEATARSNAVADLLLEAAGHWAVERGRTNAALSAPLEQVAAHQAEIAKRRQAADVAYAEAMARLTEDRFSQPALLDKARAAHDRVAALRGRVDGELAKPFDQRDRAVAKQWFPTLTALIDETQSIRLIATRSGGGEAATLSDIAELKHFVWVMSEYAGRERARIGALVSSDSPMNTASTAELAMFRGRVDLAWSRLIAAREAGLLPPRVLTAMDEVERRFLGDFQKVREQMYQAGAAGGLYPLDGPGWMKESTAAIDTLLALSRAMGEHSDVLARQVQRESLVSLLGAAAALAGGLGIAVWAAALVRSRVTRPIGRMTTVMTELAGGNTDVGFVARTEDEIGALARAFMHFKESMIKDRQHRLAERLEAEEQITRKRRIETLTADFDAAIREVLGTVSGAAERLHASATAMSVNAEQTNRQSAVVSSATEQASANVETVSAAGTELNASIHEIARQVARSAEMASRAVDEAGAVNQRIGSLAEAANKVGQIVQLINAIASQTNLLALNATIEAARAGEAGKGFAVVANEVKSLANQTAKATDEIAAQVAAIQGETTAAVTAIRGITGTIAEVNQLAASVAAAVEEQSSATGEISRSVAEASRGTAEVAANIAGVAQAAGETGRMAKEVYDAASLLIGESRRMEDQVEHFLTDMRQD